jgi:hypothetical protein
MKNNFTIFVSYSWVDSEIVNKIDNDLSAIGLNIVRKELTYLDWRVLLMMLEIY